jgi:hypothetical protein
MMLQQKQSAQYNEMAMRGMQQQQQNAMSPQEQADLNLQSGLKQAEAKHRLEQKWLAEDEAKAKTKRAENEARVRALNAEAKGRGIFYWVDENGAIKESRENVQRDAGGAGKAGSQMKFKDAMAETVALFTSFGVEAPQRTPVFNRVFGYMKDEDYQSAQAVLRSYQMRVNVWPKKAVLPMDFQYTLPTGEKIDPQQYTETLAYMGKSDEELKAAFDDILKQAREMGVLPKPPSTADAIVTSDKVKQPFNRFVR